MSAPSLWTSFPSDLKAIAPRTGPFPLRPFLEALWHHQADPSDQLHIEASTSGAAAVVSSDGTVRFAGPEHLTDYHSPVGTDGATALASALKRFSNSAIILDSVPLEAVDPIVTALDESHMGPSVSEHESTAVLPLPDSYEDWVMSLGKKQRHELRRKRRRFEQEFGAITVERNTGNAIEAFCAMHRLSAGAKGQFMTAPMQDCFAALMESAGASIHFLSCDGVPRAAAFGFETEDGYYFYNSAYDPEAAAASPGIVLFSAMIETEIDRGATMFDFLKGDESYKYRHGAERRQLYTIKGKTP